MRNLAGIALAVAAVLSATTANAQTPNGDVIVLRHASLLDGVNAQPRRDVAITNSTFRSARRWAV